MNAPAPSWQRWFFPQGRISQVALEQVRDGLIAVFKHWGMPDAIKVDNGQPFGDPQKKTIPVLALWLLCLKIKVIWNRPRQPRDNAKVERMQGTSKRWADLDRCSTTADLQRRLDEVAKLQREHYEVSRLGFKTRKAAFPALFEVKRRYRCDGFDARRAYRFLAKARLVRRVSSTGRIRLYGHGYQVGLGYKAQPVVIGFDAETLEWLVYDEQGEAIRRLAAKSLSPAHLRSLSISQRAQSR